MLTDIEVNQLLERVKALEENQEDQKAFDLEFRAALLAVVAVIERRWKIGKYKQHLKAEGEPIKVVINYP